MESFDDWPARCPAKPIELARAGFYYAGYADGILDCVRCFYCNVGLCMWERGDVPIGEHFRASPDCKFIHGMTSV